MRPTTAAQTGKEDKDNAVAMKIHQARGQLKLLEFRCHAQLETTPQFGMADWDGPIPISGS